MDWIGGGGRREDGRGDDIGMVVLLRRADRDCSGGCRDHQRALGVRRLSSDFSWATKSRRSLV